MASIDEQADDLRILRGLSPGTPPVAVLAHALIAPRGRVVVDGAQTEEYRPMKVVGNSYQAVATATTITLCDLTGPGNIEYFDESIGTDYSASMIDSRLKITIDGVVEMDCDLGTFWLTHGTFGASNIFWKTDDFALQHLSSVLGGAGSFGSMRRMFIPYASSCKIELTNNSGQPLTHYYQIQYRSGAIPAFLTGSRRVKWHCKVTPFTGVAEFAALDLIDITGKRGVVDTIQCFAYANTEDDWPSWLEGDPSWVADGVTSTYTAWEDFMLAKFYDLANPNLPMESGGILQRRFQTDYYGTGMFRCFRKDPLLFDSSFKFTIRNTSDPDPNAVPINVSALVFYYTDQ